MILGCALALGEVVTGASVVGGMVAMGTTVTLATKWVIKGNPNLAKENFVYRNFTRIYFIESACIIIHNVSCIKFH
jgi:hypothetical protein